jgi:hypothetical protein
MIQETVIYTAGENEVPEPDTTKEKLFINQQLNQQGELQRRRMFKKRTQGNSASRKKLIAVHIRVIRRALPVVCKRNMRKRPGSESIARRIPQERICPEFNIGKDNRVVKKQLQPKVERTSDKFIKKFIEIKENIWRYIILKPKDTKLINQLQVMENWAYWKFRPPPKRKKKLIKQQGRSTTTKT